MISKIETLPNEILLHIFSCLTWDNMLTSLWSLNARFNSLICLTLSINDNRLNNGLVIVHGLSYNKCCSILFPLILNSSSLCSSIQRIHFDGTNLMSSDLCYQLLFNNKNILHFPHLKSLILTRCGSIEPVIQSLVYLIKYQLDELTLTFDDDIFARFFFLGKRLSKVSYKENQLNMIKEFVCRLFSTQCQLTSLRLDISNEFRCGFLHQCLSSNSDLSSNLIQSCNITLRRLHIRLNYARFLESLIEYIPNLEQISVEFIGSLQIDTLWKSNIEALKQSNENWFNKVSKLQCLSLKSFIDDDLEFIYLKWILNNLNYVKKLQVHIKSCKLDDRKCQNIWKYLIDANFIRQYCLPDRIPNLIDFNFYISSQCQLSYDDNSMMIIDQNEIRAKVLAHLISMTVQLKYLRIERFEWLLDVIQHASNELRINSLTTVRYVEFCLPSCHNGYETIHIGKRLVPFISTYMPHLQTLRLWRPDDFPWTTIRPDYKRYYDDLLLLQWLNSLEAPESIAQHVIIFEQDLCQLIDKLRDFTFLDIYGKIHYKKVEPYRLMVQARFPDSRVNVDVSRFRLWL
ncbi:unnamed protein product [Rotaria sordida]|uniref:F-box domain-containing protein n=1 Tax=Rotaria sordida TaxID=392033 RepID=A0A814I4F4_9BILA|nr:unnamed protein product [Rotaria sordida]CAF1130776.1 unnamed protein product [Rotaria sordida]